MNRVVIGQVINIVPDDPFSVLTIETASGDIVKVRHDETAHGLSPSMGGIYAVEYIVDGGTLIAVNVSRPKPGQYRDSYRPPADVPSQRTSRSPPLRKPPHPRSPAVVHDASSHDEDGFFPTSYPRIEPQYPARIDGSREERHASVHHPETPPLSQPRPGGIDLIVAAYLILGVLLLIAPWMFAGIVGLVFFVLAIGLFTYQGWAYDITRMLVIMSCFTIVGIIVAIPAWRYLNSDDIRFLFIRS